MPCCLFLSRMIAVLLFLMVPTLTSRFPRLDCVHPHNRLCAPTRARARREGGGRFLALSLKNHNKCTWEESRTEGSAGQKGVWGKSEGSSEDQKDRKVRRRCRERGGRSERSEGQKTVWGKRACRSEDQKQGSERRSEGGLGKEGGSEHQKVKMGCGKRGQVRRGCGKRGRVRRACGKRADQKILVRKDLVRSEGSGQCGEKRRVRRIRRIRRPEGRVGKEGR